MKQSIETVNHNILIHKLKLMGFTNSALDLLINYLNHRFQTTMVNQATSNPMKLKLGIPQGTILAAWLFILFINDLFNIPTKGQTICFADDTLLLYEVDRNLKLIPDDINQSIDKFNEWFSRNLLTIFALYQ